MSKIFSHGLPGIFLISCHGGGVFCVCDNDTTIEILQLIFEYLNKVKNSFSLKAFQMFYQQSSKQRVQQT